MKAVKKQHSIQGSKANVNTQEQFAGATSTLSTPSAAASENWIADTGATAHMTLL